MVTYRVFDKKTNEDITDKRFWVIGSDGTFIEVYCDGLD